MGKGRVTIPTDLDVVPQTLEMIDFTVGIPLTTM